MIEPTLRTEDGGARVISPGHLLGSLRCTAEGSWAGVNSAEALQKGPLEVCTCRDLSDNALDGRSASGPSISLESRPGLFHRQTDISQPNNLCLRSHVPTSQMQEMLCKLEQKLAHSSRWCNFYGTLENYRLIQLRIADPSILPSLSKTLDPGLGLLLPQCHAC